MDNEQHQIGDSQSISQEFSFFAYLTQVWDRRKWIAIFVMATTVISIVIVFLQPKLYTAETTILPELEKNKLLGLGGVSDLAAVSGVSLGDSPVSKLYPMIITSARVLREVIYAHYATPAVGDSVDLIQFWRIDGFSEEEKFERALKKLRSRMDVSFDNRLGTLVLKVDVEVPSLAADVANKVTDELDIYTRRRRRTSVTAQREFIEQRLQEVDRSLKNAENTLRSFREKNRRIVDSPQLMLEQGRLERELQINSTIFVELKKQIEVAKIEEIKNIPIINVLDAARIPVVRSSPNRIGTALSMFSLSLIFACAVAAFEQSIYRIFVGFKQIISANMRKQV